jgi:hypothetical protein
MELAKMREISISIDVFARIWSLRESGEDSENAILKRILWSIPDLPSPFAHNLGTENSGGGVIDRRYGVRFPEGFSVERVYLGKHYKAFVQGGQWVVEGVGRGFARLNELSRAIGTKTENAWVNWFYFDSSGKRRPVSDLRASSTISVRTPENVSRTIGNENWGATVKKGEGEMMQDDKVRWCDDVREALSNLGGQASLYEIYKQVEKIRRNAARSVPRSLEATVRRTLEDFSSDSENYRGEDWFVMPEGKGRGIWALRNSKK